MPHEKKSGGKHHDYSHGSSDHTIEHTHKKEVTEVRRSNAGVWILAALLLLTAAFFIPWYTVSRIETVPYQGVEEYTIQEPYTTTQVDSSQGYRMPLYRIEGDYTTTSGNTALVGCTIINDEPTSVRYGYYIYTTDKNATNTPEGTTSFSQSTDLTYVTIAGEESMHLNATLPHKEFFGCYVLPSIIARDGLVTTSQNITEYRNVTRTREVTKYQNYAVHQRVNWILGRPMPWHQEWRA